MKKFIIFFVLCLMATLNINAQTYYNTELTDVHYDAHHYSQKKGSIEVCAVAGVHPASIEFFNNRYILMFDRCFEYDQCFIFKDKEELCKTLTFFNNITKGGFFTFPDGTTFDISVYSSITFENRKLRMYWTRIDKKTIQRLLEKLEKFEES